MFTAKFNHSQTLNQDPLPSIPNPTVSLHTDSLILNLSKSFILTSTQSLLLEKGLSFIPTPTTQDREGLRRDIHSYHRRLKLSDHFKNKPQCDPIPFTLPSTWEPLDSQVDGKLQTLINQDLHSLSNYLPRLFDPSHLNISPEEKRAIIQLRNHPNIIIKPADKGSKIVILDTHQYLREANRQLSNPLHYKPINHSLQPQAKDKIRNLVLELYTNHFICKKQYDFLIGPDQPRPRAFYLLPKIHKPPESWTVPFEVPPGRPIVSDCSSTTYNISFFIDHFLNPLSSKHPSYIQDTYDFIHKIRPMAVPNHTYLFTIDVESLYTNIDTATGLHTVRNKFNQFPDPKRPDNILLHLLQICLTHNDFEFDDRLYLQIHGTAMGQRFAPAYANIFMSEWEREALAKCPLKPFFYYRFLDDIIGAWTHTLEQFTDFINILNTHHPTIKLKATIDPHSVNFLDTTIFLTPSTPTHSSLSTKVFFKPTDTHALLHKTSYHPKHTFRGIIKSQIIRFHRICTFPTDLQEAIVTLFKALRHRGYSKRFLRKIKTDTLMFLALTRSDPPSYPTLSPNPDPNSNTPFIPLVTTFSRPTTQLHQTLKQHFTQFQSSHTHFQHHRIISAYRKNKNLQDLLTRSRFSRKPPPKPSPQDPFFKPQHFITNIHSNCSAPNTPLSLDTTNAVYIITCHKCHLQYIGETGHSIRTRLKQHLYSFSRNTRTTHIVGHFQVHNPSYLGICGLESNPGWTRAQRQRAERIWINKLKTFFPLGLN